MIQRKTIVFNQI